MTYGIKITGNDGTNDFIVMDSDENADNYQIVATGTGSYVNLTDSAYGGNTGNPRLFFEPVGDITTADVTNNGDTYNFKRYAVTEDPTDNNKITDVTVYTQSVNWIIIKDVANSPSNTAQGNYGIQVFKSNGNTAFDSRKLNSNDSFRLLGVPELRTLSGDYLNADATVGTSFNSANTSYYVAAENLFYEDNGNSGNVHGYSIVGPSAAKLLRHAFLTWTYQGSGGRTNQTRYFSNGFPIIYGEKR